MYPTAKFPKFVEDAAECCDWVVKNIKKYTPAERIFVGGSSAGGAIQIEYSEENFIATLVSEIK